MISPKYLLKKIPEIYHCKLCKYKANKKHINSILTHLQNNHNITRGSRKDGPSKKFIKYIEQNFGNPLCACGCGKKVELHKRKMQFNFFAPNCKNKGRFNNPCCPEFYLFRGHRVEEINKIISKTQLKLVTKERKERLSKINSGTNNPLSYESITKRLGSKKAAKKYLTNHSMSGKDNPFYGHKHTEETKRICALASSRCPRISSLQIKLYNILDILKISYFREDKNPNECMVDSWIFDCMVPISNKTLLIECQGKYWHNKPEVIERDKRKKDHIKTYGDKYCILYIWEDEFKDEKRIEKRIKYEIKKHKKDK